MTYINKHSEYIDKRLSTKILDKYDEFYIVDTSHDTIINVLGHCLFTNLIRDFFTRTYVKENKCADCGKTAEERCHGIGEERPKLIRDALEKVYSDNSQKISLKTIILEFLELHKYTKFALKCKACHKKEKVKKD